MNQILQVWIDSKTMTPKAFKAKYIVNLREEMSKPLTPEMEEWLQSRITHAAGQKSIA